MRVRLAPHVENTIHRLALAENRSGMMIGGASGAMIGSLLGGGLSSGAGALSAILWPAALFAGLMGGAKLSQGIDIGKMLDTSGISGFAMRIQESIKAAFNADGMVGVGRLASPAGSSLMVSRSLPFTNSTEPE